MGGEEAWRWESGWRRYSAPYRISTLVEVAAYGPERLRKIDRWTRRLAALYDRDPLGAAAAERQREDSPFVCGRAWVTVDRRILLDEMETVFDAELRVARRAPTVPEMSACALFESGAWRDYAGSAEAHALAEEGVVGVNAAWGPQWAVAVARIP